MSCSPAVKKPVPDTIVVTQIEKQENPEVFLSEYADPDEPNEQTWGALVDYIFEQRAINAKHNADKRKLLKR